MTAVKRARSLTGAKRQIQTTEIMVVVTAQATTAVVRTNRWGTSHDRRGGAKAPRR